MWADAAGYYVYLPATFIYQWDMHKIAGGMDTLTGRGFTLDTAKEVIFTKYTSGVAFLQLPFFGLTHLYCQLSGTKADGFTQPYVNSLLFSGVFYMLAGLFLLCKVLQAYYSKTASILASIALVACTNLYFYGIEHPGISHVYTFFLCSLVIYSLQYHGDRQMLLILPLCALIFLIRPTNIILLGMIAAFMIYRKKQAFSGLSFSYCIYGSLIACLIFMPQMFYWKYASGQWITYSYKGEGFTHWKAPKILEVLFAPCNGFITYAPIIIFAFTGLLIRPLQKTFTYIILLLTGLLIYTNASWWSWGFGCAYGGRAFIDYYPFFAIGLAGFIQYVVSRPKITRTGFSALGIVFAAYNILFIYGYDDCWYSSTWDYTHILKVLKG
jgi:hypothetical protein